LLIIILSGVFVGFCFDFYRIVRWQMGWNKFWTLLGDLLFSFIALFVIYYFAQKANFLELRFYLFGGSLLGLILYLRFLSPASKQLFGVLLSIVNGLKNVILRIWRTFFKGAVYLLTTLMRIPYAILCWFALLIFRLGEALGKESMTNVKRRLPKYPRR